MFKKFEVVVTGSCDGKRFLDSYGFVIGKNDKTCLIEFEEPISGHAGEKLFDKDWEGSNKGKDKHCWYIETQNNPNINIIRFSDTTEDISNIADNILKKLA